MSPLTPLEREHVWSERGRPQLEVSNSVRRRRASAARTRRRRLLAIDLGLGLGLALLALVLAPGLAILAIVAAAVLLTCGASLLYGRTRRHFVARRSGGGGEATPAAPRRD